MQVYDGSKLQAIILGAVDSCSAGVSAYSYTFLCKVVCLSVCRLWYSCTLLKLFDGFRYTTLARILVRSNDTLCQTGVSGRRETGDFGIRPQEKHAIANCSQTVSPMLPLGEYTRTINSAFCKVTLTGPCFVSRQKYSRLCIQDNTATRRSKPIGSFQRTFVIRR